MGLHVQGELFLGLEVELHHGVGQGVRVRLKRRNKAQHGTAEGAVNLKQKYFLGTVSFRHIHIDFPKKHKMSKVKIVFGTFTPHYFSP